MDEYYFKPYMCVDTTLKFWNKLRHHLVSIVTRCFPSNHVNFKAFPLFTYHYMSKAENVLNVILYHFRSNYIHYTPLIYIYIYIESFQVGIHSVNINWSLVEELSRRGLLPTCEICMIYIWRHVCQNSELLVLITSPCCTATYSFSTHERSILFGIFKLPMLQ